MWTSRPWQIVRNSSQKRWKKGSWAQEYSHMLSCVQGDHPTIRRRAVHTRSRRARRRWRQPRRWGVAARVARWRDCSSRDDPGGASQWRCRRGRRHLSHKWRDAQQQELASSVKKNSSSSGQSSSSGHKLWCSCCSTCKEAHPCDDDGCEVVPLRSGPV